METMFLYYTMDKPPLFPQHKGWGPPSTRVPQVGPPLVLYSIAVSLTDRHTTLRDHQSQ